MASETYWKTKARREEKEFSRRTGESYDVEERLKKSDRLAFLPNSFLPTYTNEYLILLTLGSLSLWATETYPMSTPWTKRKRVQCRHFQRILITVSTIVFVDRATSNREVHSEHQQTIHKYLDSDWGMQLYVFPTATTIDCRRRRRRRFDEPTDHSFLFTFNGIEPLAIVFPLAECSSYFSFFIFSFLLSPFVDFKRRIRTFSSIQKIVRK